MSKATLFLTLIFTLFLVHESSAQGRQSQYTNVMNGIERTYYGAFGQGNPYANVDMLNHVRREKFDTVLPRVMREREVDMWIHIIRPWSWGGTDPLRFEFGTKSAVLIFTDRGGDRIERVVFQGQVIDPGAFDIVRGTSRYMSQENYELMDYWIENPDSDLKSEMDLRFLDLGEFVAERDPKRIAVNYHETLSLAEGSETFTLALTDGISHADYVQLSKALGDIYAKRMISAEHMIVDYLTRTTSAEVVLLGGSGQPRRPREFEPITPGVTTLADLGGAWSSSRNVGNIDMSGISYADYKRLIQDAKRDTPLQLGDMIQSGLTLYYILREGETQPPPEVQRYWDAVVKARKIITENIEVGDTGKEALERIVKKLKEEGFEYSDYDIFDPSLDPEKPQVHLDLHSLGKGVLAPRVSPMGPKWHWNKKIPYLCTLAIEYMVNMPVPERGPGSFFYYCSLHERTVVTRRGAEFTAPPIAGVRTIP